MFTLSNAFFPYIGAIGLQVSLDAGVVINNGSSTFIPAQTVSLAANTTTYVFLNTSSIVVQSNTSGFPSSNCYPIAIVITADSTVTTITDKRPDVQGSGTGSSSILINGSTISNPNFNDTTPAAAANNINVTWHVSGSNVSASIDTTSIITAPAAPTTSVQFNNGGVFGGSSSFEWDNTNIQLAIGVQGTRTNAFNGIPALIVQAGVGLNPLEIHSANSVGIDLYSHSNTAGVLSTINLLRSRGTQSSPTVIQSGNNIGSLSFCGYDGTAYQQSGRINFQASETWSGTARGTQAAIAVMTNGTTVTKNAILIGNDAFVGIGNLINTTFALFQLQTAPGNSVALGAASTAPTDGNIGGGQVVFWLDQSANNFVVRAKYGTNTLKTGVFPLTSDGTETANTVWAGPTTGASATPTFRSLVTADLPAGTGTVTSVTFTGDGTVLSSTPSSAVTTSGTLTAALASAAGGTVLGRSAGTTGAPSYTSTPVLGINASVAGTLGIANGSGSGTTITIQNLGNTTAYNFNLPTTPGTAGQVLTSQGGGSTSMTWVTTGGGGTVTSVALATGGGASDALYTITGSPVTGAGTLTETLNIQSANLVFAGPTSGGAATPTFRALVAADVPAATVLWNNIGSATGALTLANTTFATTFNQTSAANWTWANTTPTVVSLVLTQVTVSGGSTTYTGTITGGGSNAYVGASVTFAGFVTGGNNVAAQTITASTATTLVVATTTQANETHAGTAVSSAAVSSPIFNINSTYTTGSASALDSWTLQDVLGGVAANATSKLTFTHTGSSGSAVVYSNIFQTTTLDVGGTTNIGQNTVTFAGGTFPGLLFKGANVFGMKMTGAQLQMSSAYPISWSSGAVSGNTASDTGISRLGAASIALGNGTASDITGNLSLNTIISYGGATTVAQGVPSEIVLVDLTAQSAAIGATNLTASAPRTGMYRISMSATITTAATTSSVLGGTNGFQIVFTSPTDSVAKTTVAGNSVTSAANTTTTAIADTITVYAKTGTAIQYQFDYTSVGVTAMQFELHLRLEAL